MASKKFKATILFVDDDEDFAHALLRILEGENYRVHHACDGEVGLRMAVEKQPDLIIMDVMMPVKNGFETLLELRQIDGMEDVPVLIMTSFGQDIGEIHGLRQCDGSPQIQDCLEKPVEPNVFLDRVAAALKV